MFEYLVTDHHVNLPSNTPLKGKKKPTVVGDEEKVDAVTNSVLSIQMQLFPINHAYIFMFSQTFLNL